MYSVGHHNHINIDLMNFSTAKENQIRDETARDPALNDLGQVIYNGWPQTIQELSTALWEYWAYRDALAMENDLLLKGREVLIPALLRPDILTQLHSGRQGIEKPRCFTHESVFWPRSNKDIEPLCQSCELCRELQPQQPQQLMQMPEKPGIPCVKVGTNLSEIDGKSYLIISSNQSNFYSANIPGETRLSGATVKSVFNSKIEETVP